jgi:N-acetylglutamate synthase-like GNAT family acetyltransferase
MDIANPLFFAEDAGQIVRVAAMSGEGKSTLNYVDPDFRFRGVSKTLVFSMEESARTLGLAECWLETTKTALRFYQALGYTASEQSHKLPVAGSPAFILPKRL